MIRHTPAIIVTVKIMYNNNPSAMFLGSESGDTFTQVGYDYQDEARPDGDMNLWYKDECETWFEILNREDHDAPRSMSVGDRVVFEFGDSEVTYECKPIGWEKV